VSNSIEVFDDKIPSDEGSMSALVASLLENNAKADISLLHTLCHRARLMQIGTEDTEESALMADFLSVAIRYRDAITAMFGRSLVSHNSLGVFYFDLSEENRNNGYKLFRELTKEIKRRLKG